MWQKSLKQYFSPLYKPPLCDTPTTAERQNKFVLKQNIRFVYLYLKSFKKGIDRHIIL